MNMAWLETPEQLALQDAARAIVRDLTHGWVLSWCVKTDRFILERLLLPVVLTQK